MKQRFDAISDPRSPKYQQFMTRDEIVVMSSPSEAVHSAITGWLATVHDLVPPTTDATSKKITPDASLSDMTISNHGDAIHVQRMPLHIAELLLDTRFGRFHHRNGAALIRQYGKRSRLSIATPICQSSC